MELGTISYKNKIYNLDYMKSEEIKNLLNIVEDENNNNFKEAKKSVKK